MQQVETPSRSNYHNNTLINRKIKLKTPSQRGGNNKTK